MMNKKTSNSEDIITEGFKYIIKQQNTEPINEDDEFILLNNLKTYLLKNYINCYFKFVFKLTEDTQDKAKDTYYHWILYLSDFKLCIDLYGIYELEDYQEKIAAQYNHDKNLVFIMSTEPVFVEKYPIIKELIDWFNTNNLIQLMLEDEELKKYLKPCKIINTDDKIPF